jgi:hypothetical protein
VEGAKPRIKKYYQTRDVLSVNDIEGAKAKGPYLRERTKFDAFNYDDVTKDFFKSSRVTNPLQPTYKIRNEEGKLIEIGDIPGSSPRKLPMRNTPFDGAYNVKDIPGTAPGSKRLGPFHSLTRKDFIDPNDIKDIEGTKAGTLKKGVQTIRVIDPLNPNYKLPGATEIENPDHNPYGGSSMDPRFLAAKKAMEARQQAL